MSILVTGGCGFIGSNFLNYALQKYPNTRFVNLDKLDYCSDVDNVNTSSNYTFVKGDITDGYLVLKLLNQYEIRKVIHFAAYSHVDNSFDNSLEFTRNNVLGTHQLLESCRIWGKIERFIHISTDEVYGDVEAGEYKCEGALLLPTNPYAATKAAAEMLVNSYKKSYNLPVIITRSNNIYGPNQYPEKVIPKFILQNIKNIPYTIQNGDAKRSFLYVGDVVKAFDLILNNGVIGEIYNIGSHQEISIRDLCTYINNCTGYKNIYQQIPDRPFNDTRYGIDNTKIIQLGWTPTTYFIDGLLHTYDSIRKKYKI